MLLLCKDHSENLLIPLGAQVELINSLLVVEESVCPAKPIVLLQDCVNSSILLLGVNLDLIDSVPMHNCLVQKLYTLLMIETLLLSFFVATDRFVCAATYFD